ncbi:Protein VAC14 [Chionoecetes opilio]|uniref:Protein VAC14 n=1 Tax=Chionoecetes opilio TaxID=41210 RepID=A0A8J5CW03_CHIOP|nr:Protein VAC14 [Chionoecetes opilio]
MLRPEDILPHVAELLQEEEDLIFASRWCRLSFLPSSSPQRKKSFPQDTTKDPPPPQRAGAVCEALSGPGSHNPVASLTYAPHQNYTHAATSSTPVYHLMPNTRRPNGLGDIEVTAGLPGEVDSGAARRVYPSQVLYLSVPPDLRLQLLDPVATLGPLDGDPDGLLLLLPQTKAFIQLHDRLDCVPPPHLAQVEHTHSRPQQSHLASNRDFGDLLAHLNTVQEKHRHYKTQKIKQSYSHNVDPFTRS